MSGGGALNWKAATKLINCTVKQLFVKKKITRPTFQRLALPHYFGEDNTRLCFEHSVSIC